LRRQGLRLEETRITSNVLQKTEELVFVVYVSFLFIGLKKKNISKKKKKKIVFKKKKK